MTTQTRQYQTSLDGISNLHLATVSLPAPEGKQILVKIKAVSLNYKDAETIEGQFKHHKSSVAPANLVPCADSAGEVVAIGPEVSRWGKGGRVLSTSYPDYRSGTMKPEYLAKGVGSGINGVLTEYRLFDEGAVVRTPQYLSDAEACTLQIAGTTAWMALNSANPLHQPPDHTGQTVLLLGTGGVSMTGLLFAKASGARVIITSSSDSKLSRAKELGADETINYSKTPAWDDEVLRLTDGHGADVIFENGGAGTTARSFNAVAWGGTIASIGYVSGKTDPEGQRENINVSAIRKQFTLKGLLNGPRERFEEMLGFCERHEIRPVVDRVFGFEEAREALAYLWRGGHFGKVVIKVSE